MVSGQIKTGEYREKVMVMGKPLDVVVVDDEEQITELIKTFILITSKTANVHTFTDSKQARDYLLCNSTNLLITDYKMPDYNGIQLLEAASPKTRKVLISGYISEIAEEKLQKLDAVFFEKPVPIRALRKIIIDEESQACA